MLVGGLHMRSRVGGDEELHRDFMKGLVKCTAKFSAFYFEGGEAQRKDFDQRDGPIRISLSNIDGCPLGPSCLIYKDAITPSPFVQAASPFLTRR